jgi:hypothetical protein
MSAASDQALSASIHHDAGGSTALTYSGRVFADAGAEKGPAQGLITEPGDMVVYCAGLPGTLWPATPYFEDETFAAARRFRRHSGAIHSLLASSLPAPEVQIL